MKYRKADATHFLKSEDKATGAVELHDCLPLRENEDGSIRVILFDDTTSCTEVHNVDPKEILSTQDVSEEIIGHILSDIAVRERWFSSRSH